MKKSLFTVVLTMTCLLGLGISAHAQDASRVVVKVPFEFVAGGKTLPAGTTPAGVYTILTPRAVTKLAQMNDHGVTSSSGN